MEIIENFGLDPYLFGAQVINFLIILYLLKRFLYKPVFDLLKKRAREITEGLKQAEEGKIVLEKAKVLEKEILQKARSEAKRTIDEAKVQSLIVKGEISENARLESQRILLEAQAKIDENSREAEKRLAEQVSRVSIDYLKRALSDIFSEKEQEEVFNRAVKELKKPS